MVRDSSGNLFGTTLFGGAFNSGTVFEVPSGTNSITALASFDGTNGRVPVAQTGLVVDPGGNLFGITGYGGTTNQGTLFEVHQGSGTITTLVTFNGTNGASPRSLIVDSSGTVFGTTAGGGAFSDGTIFEVPSGTGTLVTLASFNGSNGSQPAGGIALDSNGNLFGITAETPTGYGYGALFELPRGSGTINSLASFDGTVGVGSYASGVVVDSSGNTFVALLGGVLEVAAGSHTVTTVTNISTSGILIVDSSDNVFMAGSQAGPTFSVFEKQHGSSTFTTLATGSGFGGVTLSAIDSSGNLYGVVQGGGLYFPDRGKVFEVPSGSGTVVTVAAFHGTTGARAHSRLVEDSSGNLFGATTVGGAFGAGTIFEVKQGSNTVAVLANFNGTNGIAPGGLILDSNGNLFGTTAYGGIGFDPAHPDPGAGYGTVFELASGSSTITTLASFDGSNGSLPGYDSIYGNDTYPGSLIADSHGNFFGTTLVGGAYNHGTVFELPSGSGNITTLASFDGTNGAAPAPTLALDSSGNLFGTTMLGGASSSGTVFEVQPGSGTSTVLANLNTHTGNDGLVLDSSGNLYFLASNQIFELPQGSGTATTLVDFGPDPTYGEPDGNLIVDNNGNLFGTCMGGPLGGGGVFEIKQGSSTITGLANLPGRYYGSDAISLIEDTSGNLFGTTRGYLDTEGTIFEVPAPIKISPATLPNGTAGLAYSQTLLASGGLGTLTFSTLAGTLPKGLVLSSTGVISGTPSTLGTYTFTVLAGESLGDSSSQSYTVIIGPPITITTTTLADGAAGTPYLQAISATGGMGVIVFNLTSGTLPTGLTLSTAGVLAGTPTSPGQYSFTVTATDSIGTTATYAYSLSVPAGLSQYLVTVQGSGTVQAGSLFAVSVQAADQYGDPIHNYTGPAGVTASVSPPSAASSFPITVPINGLGQGFFLASLKQAGSYTITVSSGSFSGSTTTPVIVTAGPPSRVAFAAQPLSTPTGVALPAVTIQILDAYGNVVTSDNSDAVTVGVASGPPGAPGFTPASTTTATVVNGVATFSNLVLATPGSYTLTELVPFLYTGPRSNSFSVTPLQVLPGSFAGTPSGFSLQLNAPILVNSMTPALYGSGASASVTPTVTLMQTTGTPPAGNVLPYQVPGSLVIDQGTNTLTFVETDTASVVNSGTPLLPDGVYVVHITSSGLNGLQARNSGGGYLDGSHAGTPGHDFSATFTVGAAAAGDDVLWVPATADGPGQALSAPGMNKVGGGYPLYLDDQTGQVTDAQTTLTYNPALLTVIPSSTATFTVTVPSSGTALLHYHGPALAAGTQTAIGFLTATVPAGTTANPVPYKAKDLLALSGVSLNGGTIPAVGGSAVHLVAYVGDADGNGAYSSSEALLITRAALQTDTGFAAYPLVDPVIVADIDGSGFIPADAALQVNEAGVGVPTANLPVPPIPSGVVFHTAARYAQATAMKTTNNTNHPNKSLLAEVAADGLYDMLAWEMLTPPSRRLLRR
jgi:uncharacterized repeat protein (TIGR03803 family)